MTPRVRELMRSLRVNSAIFEATSLASDRDERTQMLCSLLNALVDIMHIVHGQPPMPMGTRIAIVREIDRIQRAGAPWPRWPSYESGKPGAYLIAKPGFRRKPSPRPRLGYCVQWLDAYWAPCRTGRERREAGYIALPLRWVGSKPAPGDYLRVPGNRARYSYCIAECERIDPRRSARRYSLRVWCERLAADRVPRSATLHELRWDKRERSAVRAFSR